MTDFNLKAGISDAVYHADNASLSSTGARRILQCPARFKWERDNPPEPSKALDFGKLAHTIVLGEGGAITVVDADNWMTKAAKEARDAARTEGALPVLRAEYDAALAMRDAVMAHPVARDIFAEGQAELSGWWRDEPTDILLRFRPDWMTATTSGRVLCVDYKTTVSADPDDFASSVAKFGYHCQSAWYLAGLAANGIDDAAFLFVAQDKQPPYPVSVIELHADAVLLGARLNRKAIDLFAECIATDTWPAYGSGISVVDLPKWAYYKEGNQ